MNRFFQRRPEGQFLPSPPGPPLHALRRSTWSPVFQLKALITVFTAFLFGRKELLLPRSVAPASRRACGFTAATSYFIVLFNCLASLPRIDPASCFALFALYSLREDSSRQFLSASTTLKVLPQQPSIHALRMKNIIYQILFKQ